MPPMRMQAGGEVDAMPEMMASNQNAELDAAINELMMARDTADEPGEAQKAEQLAEAAVIGAQAPMADMAAQLSAAGRGDDSLLAHLRPGEVVLPPEMFEDSKFESAVENRFNELDLDPERYVVGMGIASLNPSTGLEEFGFFKKVGKFFKKVVKKVAPIAGPLANFIPGVGPLVAAGIGAATNLAAGKGLKGAIAGGLSGYGTGKLLGGIGSLGGAGAGKGGSFLSKVGEFVLPGKDKVGLIGNIGEFVLPGKDKVGLIGNIGKGIGSLFGGGGMSPEEQLGALAEGNEDMAVRIAQDLERGLSPTQVLEGLSRTPGVMPTSDNPMMQLVNYVPGQSGQSFGSDPYTQSLLDRERQAGTGRNPILAFLDDKLGLDPGGGGILGSLKNLGGGEGGGGLGLGGLGGLGVAGLLGKLAYDEAKNRKGVPLTPLTQMDAMGRYNIEAEIARRMGKEKPSAVEFGLLPERTLPQLSGGRPPMKEAPQGMMRGGMVMPMRYAEGGNVAMEDFERMNGDINGPGTETSDDVPAMLSDGEFVMTGRAVRGAGAFDMAKGDGGIITLTPSKEEDRDRGTKLMYDMMDLFSEFAGART